MIKEEGIDVGTSIFGTSVPFNDYLNQKYEQNTEYEQKLFNILIQWYEGALGISNKLYNERNNIEQLSKVYPNIFKSPENTVMYRYLRIPKSELIKQMKKLSADIYNGAKNNNKIYLFNDHIILKNIKYKSHRLCSSWTVNYDTFKYELKWDSLIGVISMTDSNCFMNPNVSAIFDLDDEEEIIHFGHTFNYPLHLIFHKSNELLTYNEIDALLNSAIHITNFKNLF